MQGNIILVEDEPDIAALICRQLEREGCSVTHFEDGSDGLAAIEKQAPELLILDLMLPGVDGFQICRELRGRVGMRDLPILVVSARSEEADVVLALELGADDYLMKPFSPRILVARARNLLRRGRLMRGEHIEDEEDAPRELRLGEVVIDPLRFEARLDDQPIALTRTEFRMLQYLAEKPGRVRERAEILEHVGGGPSLDRTVDVHVASLRRKLGRAGEWVETVRGVGYRAREAR